MSISRPSASKSRGRPLSEKTLAIRTAVLDLTTAYERMTVRGIFYKLEGTGIVPKTVGGYRSVQQQVLRMRREGLLDWSFIADGTRWQRLNPIYDSAEDALSSTIRAYRHNLWSSQALRVEVWLEKETLADLIFPVTDAWRAPLMVTRGQTSDTYVHGAASFVKDAHDYGIETLILMLYDSDSYGRSAAHKVEEKIRDYSGVPVECRLIAVTDDQIEEWNLPTRPDKVEDRSVVELDAIPPEKLTALIENTIIAVIDADAWRVEKAYEDSERELLLRLVERAV